jgi:thioredoxin 1
MTTTTNLDAVDTESFDRELADATEPVLVDFWATWCSTCRLLAPVLRDLAGDLQGSVRIVTVDADANSSLAERLGVRGLPTLLLFVDGQEKLRLSGALGKAALLRELDPWITT